LLCHAKLKVCLKVQGGQAVWIAAPNLNITTGASTLFSKQQLLSFSKPSMGQPRSRMPIFGSLKLLPIFQGYLGFSKRTDAYPAK
jgi:hypothetical protein